jgi:hypothetical protein
MTRDEMIALAKEAGWEYATDDRGFEPLWRFAALVVQAERDASMRSFQRLAVTIAETERELCAKVCEPQDGHDDPLTAWKIAAAIRARGEK